MIRSFAGAVAATLFFAPAHAYQVPQQQVGDIAMLMTERPPVDGRRIALVIGNSNHAAQQLNLKNAGNDARHIASVLGDEARGNARFDVTLVVDGNLTEMQKAIEAFAEQAKRADVVLVYYSGHGFEHAGINYLVPTDADVGAVYEDDLPHKFIDMQRVARLAQGRGLTMFFLDACRDAGPTIMKQGAGTKGLERAAQFGSLRAPDSAVVYATARGTYAYDAIPTSESLSPFAKAVSAGMQRPGLDLIEVFAAANAYVRGVSSDKTPPQEPMLQWSGSRRFFFLPLEGGAAAFAASAPSGDASASTAAPPAPLDLPLDQVATRDMETILMDVLEDRSAADIRQLAESGDPIASWLYGAMLNYGYRVQRDVPGARRWLEASAQANYAPGQLALAYYLERNAQGHDDRRRAQDLYEEAAAQDFAKAQTHLAYQLTTGAAGKTDPDRAKRLYRSAGDLGHASAVHALAYLGEKERSIASLKAMSARGNREADRWLCELASGSAFSVSGAAQHCALASRAGYKSAQARLAVRYAMGDGVARSESDARYWARLAEGSPLVDPALRARIEALAK